MNLTERFIRYVRINTQSGDAEQIPSTEGQWDLARTLATDMASIGISNVRVSSNCYVFGEIPANTSRKVPSLGLIAHMDTASEASGDHVNPHIIRGYDGSRILLNEETGMSMSPEEFPALRAGIGKDIIVTDGTTLLGGDDKAGVTEILCAAEELLSHPEIPHGKICIGFTPDEEVGRGPEKFDIADFGADFAYTVDGGRLGEMECENFNGASAVLHFRGNLIHPGEAKGRMINAVLLAMEFNDGLPKNQTPADTEGREGFYHLLHLNGNVGSAESAYIIRDHDRQLFEARKNKVMDIVRAMNEKYGEGTVTADVQDSYYNMKEKIEPHMELITLAKEAMTQNGVTPVIQPIRGGTDGAQLSFRGLPCPNLCTGSENHHGPYEFAVIQDMEKIRDILVSLIQNFAKYNWKG